MAGRLVLVGTPLGHRGDLSPRAAEAIRSADLLLCEDTRSPRRLLGEDVALPRRVSCFVANEAQRVDLMLSHLTEGDTVVFISEAGMPGYSDPGARLCRAAVEAGFEVDVVPGPTAAAVALCQSGFSATGSTFFGFIARDGPQRARALSGIATATGACVLYEAGPRVPALLKDLAAAADDAAVRPAIVARELTKLHQEIRRGTVAELAGQGEVPRGEVTIVVAGTEQPPVADDGTAAAKTVLEVMLDPGLRPRQRAKRLAELTGLDDREIYERLAARRREV